MKNDKKPKATSTDKQKSKSNYQQEKGSESPKMEAPKGKKKS